MRPWFCEHRIRPYVGAPTQLERVQYIGTYLLKGRFAKRFLPVILRYFGEIGFTTYPGSTLLQSTIPKYLHVALNARTRKMLLAAATTCFLF